jgi:hypothetical protein
MATLLGERHYNIRIEGHTDNVRIHNTQFIVRGDRPAGFRHQAIEAVRPH